MLAGALPPGGTNQRGQFLKDIACLLQPPLLICADDVGVRIGIFDQTFPKYGRPQAGGGSPTSKTSVAGNVVGALLLPDGLIFLEAKLGFNVHQPNPKEILTHITQEEIQFDY